MTLSSSTRMKGPRRGRNSLASSELAVKSCMKGMCLDSVSTLVKEAMRPTGKEKNSVTTTANALPNMVLIGIFMMVDSSSSFEERGGREGERKRERREELSVLVTTATTVIMTTTTKQAIYHVPVSLVGIY